ncbi:hypothetical protein MUU77_02900 [Pseudoxanthomonas sp. F37]|jgi:hypothetical protein|uniref:hypothetical protein n=1 Tax=Pseudoxanthomonas TaxID=83618 RepID=UPI001FD196E8|nr:MULTISPECIES: hypothetical protein [Pseudoxanthomonas]UOV04274.1 hypothetical protein MUU75_14225 [Pseudoxanthomonas mexicana]UOV09270.1 hypothetical protein MUU77_02900 [Pseudoxanthomonas sp. F37]
MKYKRTRPGSNLLVWSLVVVAYAAAAATLVIETRDPQYRDLSRIGHMTIHAPEDARRLGAAQVAALYRARSGTPFSTLSPGSTIKVVWPDGSAETVRITDPSSPLGVEPVPGTQQAPP